jgi:hypothetical protein
MNPLWLHSLHGYPCLPHAETRCGAPGNALGWQLQKSAFEVGHPTSDVPLMVMLKLSLHTLKVAGIIAMYKQALLLYNAAASCCHVNNLHLQKERQHGIIRSTL